MTLLDLALQLKDYEWCKTIKKICDENIISKKQNKATDNITITIKVEQIVPFALLNHAQQYIDEDLKSIKK